MPRKLIDGSVALWYALCADSTLTFDVCGAQSHSMSNRIATYQVNRGFFRMIFHQQIKAPLWGRERGLGSGGGKLIEP